MTDTGSNTGPDELSIETVTGSTGVEETVVAGDPPASSGILMSTGWPPPFPDHVVVMYMVSPPGPWPDRELPAAPLPITPVVQPVIGIPAPQAEPLDKMDKMELAKKLIEREMARADGQRAQGLKEALEILDVLTEGLG